MGGQFPNLNQRQVEFALKKMGFVCVRTASSHAQWEGYTNGMRRIVTVQKLPSKSDLYTKERMLDMIRQAGVKKKIFYKYVEKRRK